MYRLKSPLAAQLEITNQCNNSCLHCYNYWRYTETGKKLSKDNPRYNLEHFQALLANLITQEVRTLTLTGGEPFLRRDVLFPLIATAKRAGMKVGVNTNGALIKDGDASMLKELATDFVLVSLLSDEPNMHNWLASSKSHEHTSRAMSRLIKAGLYVSANMVVTAHNFTRVRQTAMYIKDLGLNSFSATPILPCPLALRHKDLLLVPEQVKSVLDDLLWVGNLGLEVDVLEPIVHCLFNEDERTRFAKFLDHRSCSAGISDMVISPSGDVRPCIMATETYGNLIRDGWGKVWANLSKWSDSALLPTDCLNCSLVDECGGGCRIAAFAISGKINSNDPYMTGPLNLPPASVSPNLTTALKTEMEICLPNAVLLREEDFGSVIFSGRRFMFLDRDGTQILKFIKCRGTLTLKCLLDEFEVNERELTNYIGTLISHGFIIYKG